MTREWRIAPDIQTEFATRGPDAAIAALAERQHGVVSLPQLNEFGLLPGAVRERVRSARLHRIHRGVYAVGHASLSGRGHWMAAVLACGEGSVLSHRTAAVLWGLRDGGGSRVDVTATHRTGRTRAGIQVHWRPSLARADTTSCDSIPCTSVALTLLDLASVLRAGALEKACDRAEQMRLFDARAIEELLARMTGRRGTQRLRATLSELDPLSPATRTEIERLMLALCRTHTLPQPVVNGWIQPRNRLLPRLPLAGSQADRRNRQPRNAPHPQGLRGRPPPRSAARRGGLHHAALHLAPADDGARARRKDNRRGPRACG
jgi:predicted transcriptional regulator of viral defense system